MSEFKRITRLLVAILLLVYVGSYLVLSRRGFTEADQYHMDGFYFLTPEDTGEWRFWNYACVYVYYPLIEADQLVGTGRAPGKEPLFRLNRTLDPAAGP
jgi:hypothetical protein